MHCIQALAVQVRQLSGQIPVIILYPLKANLLYVPDEFEYIEFMIKS